MTNQSTQPAAQLRAVDNNADAMRELAQAITTLATAIRESEAIHSLSGAIRDTATLTAELEYVPCTEMAFDENGQPCEATDDSGPAVFPLIPIQSRREPQADSELCRPGGCGCGERDSAEGRHARRETTPQPVEQAADGGCCQDNLTRSEATAR